MRTTIILILLILFLLILISFIFEKKFNKKESFISSLYHPTPFELNPPTLHLNKNEIKSVQHIGEYIQNLFPVEITHKNEYSSDLAILPEGQLLFNKKHEYLFVTPIHNLTFTLVVNFEKPNININSFSDLNNKRVHIVPQNGYTENLWKKLANVLNLNVEFVTYKNEKDMYSDWSSFNLDAFALLTNHPDPFITEISLLSRVNLIFWNDNLQTNSNVYFMQGVVQTTARLEDYRLFSLEKTQTGYGYRLCLFANSKMKDELIEQVIDKLVSRGNIVKNMSIGGSNYIRYHPGARKFFEKKGYLLISQKDNPACSLLAGKSICQGKEEQTANIFYKRDFSLSQEPPTDLNTLPFLKETKDELKDLENYQKLNNVNLRLNNKSIAEDLKSSLNLAWQCFGKTRYITEKACIAKTDIKGNPREPGIWDKPCLDDSECPFFQANKNYPNKRGGCINGFCQMPINVKRLGFRKYEKPANPLCHGDTLRDKNPCKRKGLMASADYAFIDDRNDRINHRELLQERGLEI